MIPAILSAFFCVLTVLLCRRAIARRRRQIAALEARLAEARLVALRLELNPHLLCNTLNAVSSLVGTDPGRAQRMIARLGALFRDSLQAGAGAEVPLARELEFLRSYIEIQKVRFGDRLNVEIEPGPGVLVAAVPDLILQPLLENAIRHAVESRESGGRIALRARRRGSTLVLQVEDNGRGPALDGSGRLRAPSRRSGVGGLGLRNTRQRLEGLYGERQCLELTPNRAGGMTASVTIPFRLAAA